MSGQVKERGRARDSSWVALHGLDVYQGRSPSIERKPGPGHGDDPPAKGSVLGDMSQRPQPDAHLIQAESICCVQANTGHAQFCAQRAIRQGHAATIDCEVRLT
jgi:hypothetical protein